MNGREVSAAVPIEHFIQALTSQLDRAQTAIALKARAGLPLTFAVKDLKLDLRAHIEMDGAVVTIRPAGPGDSEASTLHFDLTTITRPMMEENTLSLAADGDEPALHEVIGDTLSPEDLRKLEWAGVQTVSQLVQLREQGSESAIERIANVPAMRLRAALDRAARPMVRGISMAPQRDDTNANESPLLQVRGRNLLRDSTPAVRINGVEARVVSARPNELLVQPMAQALGGDIEIETGPGLRVAVPLEVT